MDSAPEYMHMNVAIRESAIQNTDFRVMTHEAYQYLGKIYGSNPLLTIKRFSYFMDESYELMDLEIKYTPIQLIPIPPIAKQSQPKILYVSKLHTMEVVLERVQRIIKFEMKGV